MDHTRFLQYLKEYALEALNRGNGDVSQAADYLEAKSRAGILARNRKEKNAALKRVRKVFSSSRGRSPYLVLKSLGLDDLAKDKL